MVMGYRKLVIGGLATALNVGVPVLFKSHNITDVVTLAALGSIATIAATYFGFNVASKKVSQNGQPG